MKRHILNHKDFKSVSIDSGNHSAKILNIHSNYVHTPAFSIMFDRRKSQDMAQINEILEKGQAPGGIVFFIKSSSIDNVFENNGLLLGSDALNLAAINKDDSTYSDRYEPEVYFQTSRYVMEVLGYIALGLYNYKDKKYNDQDEDIVLSLGLPAQLAENKEFIKEFRKQFENQTITLETVIGSEASDRNNFDKLCKTIQFSIKTVYVYSQPLGTIASMAFKDTGEINPDYVGLLEGSTLCLDGGYVTFDVYRLENAVVLINEAKSYNDLGMQSIDKTNAELWGSKNPKYFSVSEVRKLRESGAKSFKYGALKKYMYVESDVEKALDQRVAWLKERIIRKYNNFNDQTAIFTGGTGSIYYNKLPKELKEAALIAKTQYIDDDNNNILSSIFANVEGYNELTMAKLVQEGKVTPEDFIEVDVEPMIH